MIHDATIVNVIQFTMIYTKYYHKLITKDSKFHIMNSILPQHVKTTLWKEMVQYISS
jgi:hypothetical protein